MNKVVACVFIILCIMHVMLSSAVMDVTESVGFSTTKLAVRYIFDIIIYFNNLINIKDKITKYVK